LRCSHRKLDPKKSLPHRPYHTHDDKWPLVPGRVYEVDVEIWPTCIILPVGFRIAVNIAGKDFERPGGDAIPYFPFARVRPLDSRRSLRPSCEHLRR
jgi:uncharacterized protein